MDEDRVEMHGGKRQVGYRLYIQKTSKAILIKLKSKDGFQAGNLRGNVLIIMVARRF